MTPTDTELATALMALRAIAYQAEHHLAALANIASPKDSVDKADMEYTQNCLDALNPAIAWLDEQIAARLDSQNTSKRPYDF